MWISSNAATTGDTSSVPVDFLARLLAGVLVTAACCSRIDFAIEETPTKICGAAYGILNVLHTDLMADIHQDGKSLSSPISPRFLFVLDFAVFGVAVAAAFACGVRAGVLLGVACADDMRDLDGVPGSSRAIPFFCALRGVPAANAESKNAYSFLYVFGPTGGCTTIEGRLSFVLRLT